MIVGETRVTQKGQVTVPVEVQRLINAEAGDELQLTVSNDRSLVIGDSENFFDRTAGLFAAYRKTPALSLEDERSAYERGVANDADDVTGI